MSAFSLAMPGRVGVATGEPKSVEPSGPEVLNRTEIPLPVLNTLSSSLDGQASKTQTSTRGQQGISVGHEGLRPVKRFLDSSTSQPEAFPVSTTGRTQPGTTSLDITPRPSQETAGLRVAVSSGIASD
jgi:hypothetical protein